MDDSAQVWSGAIRCQIDGVDPRTTTELLRSMVHHHCTRCDAPIELVDALDAAIEEIVDTLWQRWDGIEAIEMGTSCLRLDLRLLGPDVTPDGPTVRLGPVASSFFQHVASERPRELTVSCDLLPGSAP